MPQNSAPLSLPVNHYTMPRQFSTIFNGSIYVGKIDTDPTQEVNRITVYHESEDGTLTPIAQPISINAGGYPVVSGQVVKLVVTQDYSIAVYDQLDAQAFYFPRCSGPYVLSIFHDATLHGSGIEADRLGVNLSKDAGNLLEIRKDGLYYGVTASDNLLNLYVDSINGDDAAEGTRTSPLKTLNRALAMTPENKSNTIHLRAGQTFILDRTCSITGCSRTIQPYDDPWFDGDKVPAITPANPAYHNWAVKALARPTIKSHLGYNEMNRHYSHEQVSLANGATLNLYGLIVDAVPDNDQQYESGWGPFNFGPFYGESGCTLMFGGCYLITGASEPATLNYPATVVASYSQGGMPFLMFCRCIVLNGYSVVEMSSCPAASISCQDDWPTQFEIEYLAGNTVPEFKAGRITGILRGPNGEPRNLQINFVI